MSSSNKTQEGTVSIVIPVYNAATTIEKCIASLMKQSYQDIHVILVNDASTDQSVNKLSKLIDLDKRFHLLHQDINKGASAARNLGIKYGQGEFLFFLDADDWLEQNAIELLVEHAQKTNSDLVCASHIQDFDHESKQKSDGAPNYDHVFDDKQLTLYIKSYLKSPYKFTLLVHCWGKLYNLAIVKNNGLRFNETLSQLEDVNFNFQYLVYCKKVAYKWAFIYHHRISSSSQSLSTVMGKEADATQKFLIAYQAIEQFLAVHDKEKLINADKEVSHLFITTIIITLIRLCKSFLKQPSIDVFNKLTVITKSSEVAKRLPFYTPGPNESRLLFFALKTKTPIVVLLAGLLRACVLALTK